MKIKRALISVSDKNGVVDFARELGARGVEIISTGGTAALLREQGVEAIEIGDYTGFPEMMGGRVKTLHPKIHGGLLHLRDDKTHRSEAAEHGIEAIDLVVVNLYPFEATIAREGVTLEEAIEQIDIGGPSMLRSAAKNYRSVTVIVDPKDYDAVLSEMDHHDGGTSPELRAALARKVFATTSRYDTAIAAFLKQEQESGDARLELSLPLEARLRYGENPHQKAALYGSFLDHFQQFHGKELSYNNILDISAAAELILEFEEPTVAILKHNNPCGAGSADDLREAWDKALATDRQAPFGGVIICNRPVNQGLAEAIAEIFSEVIIAPDFEADARTLLQKKKNLRLLRMRGVDAALVRSERARSVLGGVLVQDADTEACSKDLKDWTATARPPTEDELRAMEFGWKVVKHLKSNAIVYAGPDRTLGIGAGQMSRVDASRIAIWKAGEAGLSLQGSAVASDAFFPFPDGLIAAAEAGATAAIQPGGSVRDDEVIAAANERNVAMILTGVRHFRH